MIDKKPAVPVNWTHQQTANCSGESFFCIARELHINRNDALIECQPLLHSFPARIVSSNCQYSRAPLHLYW
jgi:hypothetical protein